MNLLMVLMAICHVESTGKHNAINIHDGDSPSYGYCQVKKSTAKQVGFNGHMSELWLNRETNMAVAYKYLEWQYKRYNGDIDSAIAAYNMGTARKKNGRFLNQKYVDRVKKHIKRY